MEMRKKKLPIGIENFEKLRSEDFYYIDKTGLIRELLNNWGEVNLFTRPRRFGKTLNMSTLEHFFSLNGDKRIFEGLDISKETALCEEYMGKYPVISVSLKGIDARSYETAYQMAVQVIMEAAAKFYFLLDSEKLNEHDKAVYQKLLDDNMNEGTLGSSLRRLSGMLEKHYGTKVIVLIDEYDAPLAKAHANGYYDQMISLIRSLLGEVLKTNNSLKLAVLTGCLRISKESIFTGLNNLKVLTIADERFDEYFGFTDKEVKDLLEYYGAMDHYEEVKRWYDGYQFGNAEVYCPWDVLNHCDRIRSEPHAQPENYWINTSSNDAVKRFIEESANAVTRREIENVEKIFTEYLRKTISIRDTAVKTDMKENFYHGILLGILGVKTRWGLFFNREMGEGYADILAEPDTGNMGIIIEVKYAHDGNLDGACKEALKQIEYTKYEDDLEDDGVENILKYGIACCKKRCKVMLAKK